jgi:hypothetical protein
MVVDGDCGVWVLGFIWGNPIFLFWVPFFGEDCWDFDLGE